VLALFFAMYSSCHCHRFANSLEIDRMQKQLGLLEEAVYAISKNHPEDEKVADAMKAIKKQKTANKYNDDMETRLICGFVIIGCIALFGFLLYLKLNIDAALGLAVSIAAIVTLIFYWVYDDIFPKKKKKEKENLEAIAEKDEYDLCEK
jgi:hypothetical protein